jgi:MFS family permease
MTNRWTMLALVFVARTSSGFQFQALASIAPLVVSDLHLSYAQLGTLIGLYVLPGAFFSLPGSIIGQRFGERRTVVASFALMMAGGLITASAGGFAVAASGRLLSGIGAVVMNILLSKMVADWFAGKEVSTALAVMLSSWPVGLGAAVALLGRVAAATSWRTSLFVAAAWTGVGLLLMLLYRDAPAVSAGPARNALDGRELRLSLSAGFVWGCFNASLVAIVAFGPGLLVEHGATLGDAGFIVSLAIWVTILSVPIGGLINDRLRWSVPLIVGGSIVAAAMTLLIPVLPHAALAFCLVGLAVGGPPGAIMALLPRALPPEHLATGFGVFYTVFYAMMAVTQPAAGLIRDLVGDARAPVVFAAGVMAATAVAFAIFRRIAIGQEQEQEAG